MNQDRDAERTEIAVRFADGRVSGVLSVDVARMLASVPGVTMLRRTVRESEWAEVSR